MNSKSTRDIIALLCFYVYLAILILKKITHVAFLTKKKVKTIKLYGFPVLVRYVKK